MAYLDVHEPVRDQWFDKRRQRLTGCTVLHTAEGVMDTVGPDTGAEATAEFIRTRTSPGSYHDLVDSDSWIPLVDLDHAAYHDGTGSNNWALSISFACRTSDWAAMSSERRRGFLRQGARAFAAQQAYRRAHGFPLTELQLISKAQSDAGVSGFTYHGWRDPGRRTDPGVRAPHLFPIDEFIAECRAALAGTTTEEDDMYDGTDRSVANDRHTQLANELSAQRGIQLAMDGKISAILADLAADSPLTEQQIRAAAEEGTAKAIAKLSDVVEAAVAEAMDGYEADVTTAVTANIVGKLTGAV